MSVIFHFLFLFFTSLSFQLIWLSFSSESTHQIVDFFFLWKILYIHVNWYIYFAGQQTAQVVGGQAVPVDTIRRHEVDIVLANQREMTGAAREIK